MSISFEQTKGIVEAALLAAGEPLTVARLEKLFPEKDNVQATQIRKALLELKEDCAARSVELLEVASGFRFQVKAEFAPWIQQLWEERPTRYSRALLETLALITYRQPITRGEIEDVRGVGVSSSIIKTLLEREWVRVVGHRDVPGRPALYGSTKGFLDHFGLKSLDELPSLAELRDMDQINMELDLALPGEGGALVEEGAEATAVAASDELAAADAGTETEVEATDVIVAAVSEAEEETVSDAAEVNLEVEADAEPEREAETPEITSESAREPVAA